MLLLEIQSEVGEDIKFVDPTPEQICQAVEQCCFGDTNMWIVLSRSDENWVESDGKTGITFRQGGSGVFCYEGPIDYTTTLGVFLSYARNEETWKMNFLWSWEDRGLA